MRRHGDQLHQLPEYVQELGPRAAVRRHVAPSGVLGVSPAVTYGHLREVCGNLVESAELATA